MPIYEYQCSACGHQLEVIQKMSDKPLTDCPECQKAALTKLVSAAGFQLKGTGWYVTDYSAKGKSRAANEARSSSEGTSGTESKSTDTKSTDSKSTEAKSTDAKLTETKSKDSSSSSKDSSSTKKSSTDSGAAS